MCVLVFDVVDLIFGFVVFMNVLDVNDDVKATFICRVAFVVDSRCFWVVNRFVLMCVCIGDYSGVIGVL